MQPYMFKMRNEPKIRKNNTNNVLKFVYVMHMFLLAQVAPVHPDGQEQVSGAVQEPPFTQGETHRGAVKKTACSALKISQANVWQQITIFSNISEKFVSNFSSTHNRPYSVSVGI